MALTDSSKFGMNEEYGKLYIGVDCFQFWMIFNETIKGNPYIIYTVEGQVPNFMIVSVVH